MLCLIKNISSVVIISIAYYLKKGKLHYFVIPLLLALSFTGGLMTARNVNKAPPELDSIYQSNRDILNQIEPAFLGVNVNYQPSVSKDGRYITFAAINVELKKIKDINIKLYDTKIRKYIDLPGLHGKGWDLAPSITADGNLIAFQSNRGGITKWDIYLYNVETKKLVDLPNLNSSFPDFNPSISPEGNFITFNSLRSLVPKIYMYNLEEKKIKPLSEE
jgi:Tol biopolymer transport system component